MRTPAEYRERVLGLCMALPALSVELADAVGCVLAETITAPIPLPSFDNSAMDGFAVIAADVEDASAEVPVSLQVIAEIPAGAATPAEVTAGSAAQIMTGAPLPAGADAIVPVENTRIQGDRVLVLAPTSVGRHLRRRGEDVVVGATVLEPGVLIGARQLALLAALGIAKVKVIARPRVTVIPTGDELVAVGNVLPAAGIYESNGLMLAEQLKAMGAVVRLLPPVSDRGTEFEAAIAVAAKDSDLIVTSGGISMGNRDIVKEVLTARADAEFEKIAMNPGMPQGCGRIGTAPIITLPGNPVSSYISAELFVRPVIRKLRGLAELEPPIRHAVCTSGFSSPAEKEQYVRGIVQGDDQLHVRPIGMQGSHVLGGLAAANCLIRVPIGVAEVAASDMVEVIDLREDR